MTLYFMNFKTLLGYFNYLFFINIINKIYPWLYTAICKFHISIMQVQNSGIGTEHIYVKLKKVIFHLDVQHFT